MCDKNSDEIIKNIIYKNKVVVFGFNDDDFTKKSIQFFKEKFNHDSLSVYLDKNVDRKTMECLKIKSKANIVPMIYLNGMFLGNYSNLTNYEYKKDLDIFF